MTLAMRKVFTVVVILAGAAGVFWLPFAFPPQTPTYSESYTLGFSNRVAVLAVWAVLGILGLLATQPIRPPFDRSSNESPKEGPLPVWVWLAAAVAYAALDLIVVSYIPLQQFGESAYTFPRVLYFAELGLHPYRDFEFAYGPALLYVPGIAQKLLGSMVPAALVYTLVHILLNAVGLAMLAWTLNAVTLKKTARIVIFVLLALAWIGPTMGMQYVVLRWVLPFALMVWVYGKIPAQSNTAVPVGALSVRVSLSAVSMLLISPEFAVVLCVALVVIHLSFWWTSGRAYLVPLFALAASLIAFVLVAGNAYLESILGFASGGMLFPVFPTLAVLVYLTSLAIAIPPVIQTVRLEGLNVARSLRFGWFLLCIGLVPGALGRCDSGHVFMYGWAAMLAASTMIFEKKGISARFWSTAWVVAFIVGGQASLFFTYKKELRPIWDASARADQLRAYPPVFATRLDAYPALQTPFQVDPTTERYLRDNGRLVPEYYRGLVDVFTQSDLDRKCANLSRSPEVCLLVPAAQLALPVQITTHHQEMDWAYYEQARESYYRKLLLFPLTYHRKQTPFTPDLLLAQHIFETYEVVEQVDEYLIMRPKSHSSSPASSSSSPSMPVEPPK